jgi:hypothetical protein
MNRTLLLATVLVAALTTSTIAEETTTKAASEQTTANSVADSRKPFVMYRRLGPRQCSPFMRTRRLLWARPVQPQGGNSGTESPRL